MLSRLCLAAALAATCLQSANTHLCSSQVHAAASGTFEAAFVSSTSSHYSKGENKLAANRCSMTRGGWHYLRLAQSKLGDGIGVMAAQRQGRCQGRLRGLRMAGVSWSSSGSDHEESADEIFTNSDSTGDGDAWQQLPKIFVLLFNPRTDNEGIYTLQIKRRDGQLVNTIVMFEDTEDAERYSGLLEAQDFPSPSVEVIEPSEIKDFAMGAGYQTTFIPKGTLFMPPENSVGDRPWSPDGKRETSYDWDSDPLVRDTGVVENLESVRMNLERLYGGGMPQ